MATDLRAKIRVGTDWDDDYIGFAVGFRPGDSANSAADYLLIDWKQGDQTHDFDDTVGTPGATAYRGLAVSRVTGIPTADEFWGHVDFPSNPNGGVVELARAANLGNTGYLDFTTYEFRIVFLPGSFQLFVDSVLEISIAGSFSNGRFAFYNLSQAGLNQPAASHPYFGSLPNTRRSALCAP